jgi:hypothetical protein
MTLSALASTFGEIVRPICLAVFRLITNSNFVGCSTGKLAAARSVKFKHCPVCPNLQANYSSQQNQEAKSGLSFAFLIKLAVEFQISVRRHMDLLVALALILAAAAIVVWITKPH